MSWPWWYISSNAHILQALGCFSSCIQSKFFKSALWNEQWYNMTPFSKTRWYIPDFPHNIRIEKNKQACPFIREARVVWSFSAQSGNGYYTCWMLLWLWLNVMARNLPSKLCRYFYTKINYLVKIKQLYQEVAFLHL